MGFLDSAFNAIGGFLKSDTFRGIAQDGLSLLAQRGIRKAVTGSSGDPRTGLRIPTPGSFGDRLISSLPGGRVGIIPTAGPGGFGGALGLNPIPILREGAKAVGGAMVVDELKELFGGRAEREETKAMAQQMPGGAPVGGGGQSMAIFQPTAAASVRPVSRFEVVNPVTGNTVFYKNQGRPILWSGDLAACRRVERVARRARRARGRR